MTESYGQQMINDELVIGGGRGSWGYQMDELLVNDGSKWCSEWMVRDGVVSWMSSSRHCTIVVCCARYTFVHFPSFSIHRACKCSPWTCCCSLWAYLLQSSLVRDATPSPAPSLLHAKWSPTPLLFNSTRLLCLCRHFYVAHKSNADQLIDSSVMWSSIIMIGLRIFDWFWIDLVVEIE